MAQGVYWVGADNNIYTKVAGQNGVRNVGPVGVVNPNAFAGLSKIADPNAPQQPSATTTYDGSGTGGTGAAAAAPADLSSYDQAIQATQDQINNLGPSENNLLSGAYNQYQQTMNNLNQNKAEADQTYKQNKTTDAQDYVTNKNAIRTDTGSTINGIDTMLGAHGAGGQAAGDYAALLAGKAGTQNLTGAATTFGKNEQGLDTNYNNYVQGYNTNVTNAGLTRDATVNNAKANIDTQKANLLQQLASLTNERTSAAGGTGTGASQPFVDQAQALLKSAATEGAPTPVAPVTPTVYTAPSLLSYTTNPTSVSMGSGNGGNAATQSAAPFAATLLGRGAASATAGAAA